MNDQVLAPLRGQVVDIMFGSVFLFIGLAVCLIAAMRRRGGTRIFVWLGIWSAMYGITQLTQTQAWVAALPSWLRVGAPYVNTVMMFLILVPASLCFLELSLGKLRLVIQVAIASGLLIAVAGIGLFAMTGSSERVNPYNNLLGVSFLLPLMTVVAVPALSRKYLVLPDRRVLAIGMFLFAAEALSNSVSHLVGYRSPRILDHLGFGVLLFSFGYVALQLVLSSERRLLAVENELATAREIQTSILPSSVPELQHARISAAYLPMTEVAGDFYEFIRVDRYRSGFLVADVCGHGVPAALIASMIKVAVQTVAAHADDPAAVLRGLNRVLSSQLRGRLVSAAYLWLDTESRTALYAAAGHPPLLRWRAGKLESIESNGLLFGIMPERADYPVRELPLLPGDRFLLYTDGVTEPENAAGESFGDHRLEQVLRANDSSASAELSDRLLFEIRRWQPPAQSQQDDITLIIIDAL